MNDFTYKFLSNIPGYIGIFICAVMCYMPMKNRLKISTKKLAAVMIPSLVVLTVAGSLISSIWDISHNAIILPVSVILLFIYYKTLNADIFECMFVFIYVASLTCYTFHYSLYIDAIINLDTLESLYMDFIDLALMLCTAVIFFLRRKSIAEFMENLKKFPMKKVFWIVPLFFMALLIMMIPMDKYNVYTRQIVWLYPVIITGFLALELIIVYLFNLITREMINNEKLERENQTLEFQSKRYESLREHIKETARIRHDFRQQLRTISSFAENEKYDELKNYLAEYSESISGTEWSPFCQNVAVDAIVGYYSSMAEQQGIKTDWHIELPKELPIMESVFCGMLGNLIENAINACESMTEGEKIIHLSAQILNNKMLVVIIENSYNGIIKTDKNGDILSSKHKGRGIGISSVQTITEKYHGKMQVQYDDKTFRVNVLLKF